MSALKKYDEETQARAVRMYQDRLAEGEISLRGISGHEKLPIGGHGTAH